MHPRHLPRSMLKHAPPDAVAIRLRWHPLSLARVMSLDVREKLHDNTRVLSLLDCPQLVVPCSLKPTPVYRIAGFSSVVSPTELTAAAAAQGLPPTVFATRNPNVISCASLPPSLRQFASVVCTRCSNRRLASGPPSVPAAWDPPGAGAAAAWADRGAQPRSLGRCAPPRASLRDKGGGMPSGW